MTMPNERRWAVNTTRQFLLDLLNPKKTPRVPSAIRKEASRCQHCSYVIYNCFYDSDR